MTDLSLNLPDKRLKMKGIFATSLPRLAFGIPFALIFAAGFLWWSYLSGQDIYADYQIGRAHHVLPDARIDGECETHKAVFTTCKVSIRDGGKSWEKRFFFIDFSTEKNFTVQAIASDSDPNQVTLDLAAGKVMNRALLDAAIAAIGLILIYFTLRAIFVNLPRFLALLRGLNRAEAQPWQLTTVDAAVKNNRLTHFMADINGTECRINIDLGKKMRPWVVEASGDTARLLAFAPADGGAAVPFDRQLKTIGGLSKSERQALIAELERISGD